MASPPAQMRTRKQFRQDALHVLPRLRHLSPCSLLPSQWRSACPLPPIPQKGVPPSIFHAQALPPLSSAPMAHVFFFSPLLFSPLLMSEMYSPTPPRLTTSNIIWALIILQSLMQPVPPLLRSGLWYSSAYWHLLGDVSQILKHHPQTLHLPNTLHLPTILLTSENHNAIQTKPKKHSRSHDFCLQSLSWMCSHLSISSATSLAQVIIITCPNCRTALFPFVPASNPFSTKRPEQCS